MQERTKLICLIIFDTLIILLGFALEPVQENVGEELPTAAAILIIISLQGYILLGLVTLNLSKLLIYSFLSAIVHSIFTLTDLQYSPARYTEVLETFNNSPLIFLTFGFIFVFTLVFVFVGIGMILSYLYNSIFNKRIN